MINLYIILNFLIFKLFCLYISNIHVTGDDMFFVINETNDSHYVLFVKRVASKQV